MSNIHGTHNDGLHLMECQCNRNALYLQSLRSPCSDGCGCGSTTGYCKATSLIGPGAMTAVIDDANEITYIYGNIIHENYHMPLGECQPFIVLPTNLETYRTLVFKTEMFDGVMLNDKIILAEVPSADWPVMVFRNGLKMREGQENDYVITGKEITFTFNPTVSTDRFEIIYRYVKVGV